MGNISEFIKATGNCKIMVEKIRKYLSESTTRNQAWFLREIKSCTAIQKDENGEEFITLKDFGNIVNESKFYGYFDSEMIAGLYVVYEAMSINGMQCYESKVKAIQPLFQDNFGMNGFGIENMLFTLFANSMVRSAIPKEYTEIDGFFEERIDFKSYDELHNHFKQYLENPLENISVLKISKGFYDILITTREQEVNDETVASDEETSREESCRKKQKTLKYDESCKMYFVEEHQTYLYLEFLPYGQGIKLAVAYNYPFINYSDEYEEEEEHEDLYDRNKMELFFSRVKDEAFCWRVETLQ